MKFNYLSAGMLDRRVTLHRTSWATDTFAGRVPTTNTIEVWAAVEYNNGGGEIEKEGVINLDYDVTFYMRYREIKEDYHITYEGNKYEIEKVTEIGRHHFVAIRCSRDE